jgi:hypothetical protein
MEKLGREKSDLDGFPGDYIDIGRLVHIEEIIFDDFAKIL